MSRLDPALTILADAFAIRWYEANAAIVAYDRDLAQSFVRAIIQMNDIIHGGISQEPEPTGPLRHQVSCREFIEAFRRVDIRCLVSDEVLRQVFDATMRGTPFHGPSIDFDELYDQHQASTTSTLDL